MLSGMVTGADEEFQDLMYGGGSMERPEDVLMMLGTGGATAGGKSLAKNVPNVTNALPCWRI